MAGLTWQIATVTAIRDETPRVKTLSLMMPGWQTHRPGQHVDVRLTAADGYQAQRSYSIASAPTGQPAIDICVARLAGRGDGLRVLHTLTREQPSGWTGYSRRIDTSMLAEVVEGTGRDAEAF